MFQLPRIQDSISWDASNLKKCLPKILPVEFYQINIVHFSTAYI